MRHRHILEIQQSVGLDERLEHLLEVLECLDLVACGHNLSHPFTDGPDRFFVLLSVSREKTDGDI